jgi:GTP-binding protein HflX
VESFKTTLDEINGADLILHVVDGSSDELSYQMDTVEEVLHQIGAERIERIVVFNKKDLLPSADAARRLAETHPDSLLVSAETGEGIDELVERIAKVAASRDDLLDVVIPYQRGDLVSLAHKRCHIISEQHEEDGTHMLLYAPSDVSHLFESLR